MKISEIIKDKYKLRIPPIIYYDLLADVVEAEEEQEPKTGHWKGFTHSAYHGVDEDNEPIWKPVIVYHCSECNRRTVIKENFCPNCGARMGV